MRKSEVPQPDAEPGANNAALELVLDDGRGNQKACAE